MSNALEQDLVIASEFGFAVDAGRAEQAIDPVLAAKLQAMTDVEFDAYVLARCTQTEPVVEDRVKPEWICPNCHESHIDRLAIVQDVDGEPTDIVTCETCGIHYQIEVTPDTTY